MITRLWHGYTTPQNADAYQAILLGEVMAEIGSREIPGYLGFDGLRREGVTGPDGNEEVEFVTLMYFETLDHVKGFVGDDHEVAHVPERARRVLKRFDDRSAHYERIVSERVR